METTETTVAKTEGIDMAGAIIAGTLLVLAIYGGYKLFTNESESTSSLPARREKSLLQKMLEQEIG